MNFQIRQHLFADDFNINGWRSRVVDGKAEGPLEFPVTEASRDQKIKNKEKHRCCNWLLISLEVLLLLYPLPPLTTITSTAYFLWTPMHSN